MQRAEKLTFRGKYDDQGRPERYVSFAPARNLDAADIANLTDDEYREITSGERPLYVEAKHAEPKAKAAHTPAPKPKAGPTAEKPDRTADTSHDTPAPDAPAAGE